MSRMPVPMMRRNLSRISAHFARSTLSTAPKPIGNGKLVMISIASRICNAPSVGSHMPFVVFHKAGPSMDIGEVVLLPPIPASNMNAVCTQRIDVSAMIEVLLPLKPSALPKYSPKYLAISDPPPVHHLSGLSQLGGGNEEYACMSICGFPVPRKQCRSNSTRLQLPKQSSVAVPRRRLPPRPACRRALSAMPWASERQACNNAASSNIESQAKAS
mmetsp:Transcript_76867/g.223187  ORF Transcript_76867/g.223187 Transcript_76867/m.223187 type:complete len:216 (+) Transcript_76867:311-958(+)